MASVRNRIHDAYGINEQYIQEDELFNVSSNTIEHELDEVVKESIENTNQYPTTVLTEDEEPTEKEEKGVRQYFVDFCKQTILHGWHYLVEYEDTSESESDNTENACLPNRSPKAHNVDKRGSYQNQCSCHHVASIHNSRNRHLRHNVTKVKIPAKRKSYGNQEALNVSSNQNNEVNTEPISSSTWNENGTYKIE